MLTDKGRELSDKILGMVDDLVSKYKEGIPEEDFKHFKKVLMNILYNTLQEEKDTLYRKPFYSHMAGMS